MNFFASLYEMQLVGAPEKKAAPLPPEPPQAQETPDYVLPRLFDGEKLPSEEKYLSAWAEMGFSAETVAEAYDRTVLHCHEFRWPYCNGILKRWHEKGLHTLAEVKAENAKEQSKPKKNTMLGSRPSPNCCAFFVMQ